MLTDEERRLFFGIPDDPDGLARQYTFTRSDQDLVAARRGAAIADALLGRVVAATSLEREGSAASLTEIAQAYPQSERFEIWSQDEARAGQMADGRSLVVPTPRGWRDIGYQSAWIIGAVSPARDTGVASGDDPGSTPPR